MNQTFHLMPFYWMNLKSYFQFNLIGYFAQNQASSFSPTGVEFYWPDQRSRINITLAKVPKRFPPSSFLSFQSTFRISFCWSCTSKCIRRTLKVKICFNLSGKDFSILVFLFSFSNFLNRHLHNKLDFCKNIKEVKRKKVRNKTGLLQSFEDFYHVKKFNEELTSRTELALLKA